jgi:hypothetical protein
MEAAVPFINKAFKDWPGTVFTITSANHAPRTLRDAICVWREGMLVEGFEDILLQRRRYRQVVKRRTTALAKPNLVTIAAVAAGTDYGGKDVSETWVDDLGEFLSPID